MPENQIKPLVKEKKNGLVIHTSNNFDSGERGIT
jgi:hypothetical protein